MEPVILESPYGSSDPAKVKRNERYARFCIKDCLERGEAPFVSHLLYTQANILKDTVPEERTLGIEAGFTWRSACKKTVVYQDLGISHGMTLGVESAKKAGHIIEYRKIGWPKPINTIYLAGPMEYTDDNGLGWRERYAHSLQEFLDIECIIPNYQESHIVKSPEWFLDLKKSDPYQYIDVMTQLRWMDLEFVQEVDAVICNWEGQPMSGTIGEAQHATFHAVPFYLITKKPLHEVPGWFLSCAEEVFPELPCLMMYLADLKWKKSE